MLVGTKLDWVRPQTCTKWEGKEVSQKWCFLSLNRNEEVFDTAGPIKALLPLHAHVDLDPRLGACLA